MESTSTKGPRRHVFASTQVARTLGVVVRLARMAAFCGALLCAGVLLAAHSAHGQLGEKALDLGRDLSQFSDLLAGTHRVLLNGETIYLASSVSELGVHELGERFAAHCEEHSGGLSEEFARLPSDKQDEIRKKAPSLWDMRFGMVRRESAEESMVICFAQRPGDGVQGLIERLRAVLDTGELDRLGNLRYAYVRRLPTGKSHVLVSFTEGAFNLNRVLGRGGEPAGQDPPGAPRPPDSRRLFSVSVDGAPYGLQSFRTGAPAEQIAHFYDQKMPELGWTRDVGGPEGYHAAIYHRNGVMMTITALDLAEGKTTVTFLEGSPKNPSPEFVAR